MAQSVKAVAFHAENWMFESWPDLARSVIKSGSDSSTPKHSAKGASVPGRWRLPSLTIDYHDLVNLLFVNILYGKHVFGFFLGCLLLSFPGDVFVLNYTDEWHHRLHLYMPDFTYTYVYSKYHEYYICKN